MAAASAGFPVTDDPIPPAPPWLVDYAPFGLRSPPGDLATLRPSSAASSAVASTSRGLIAKAIVPGEQPGGIIVAALVGIAGALIAGFIAQAVGFGDPIDEFFDWSTWIAAIVGAVVLLFIWQAIAGRNRQRVV